MRIRTAVQPAAEWDGGWLALGLFEEELAAPAPWGGFPIAGIIARLAAAKDLTGSLGEALVLHGDHGPRATSLILFGLGKREKFDEGRATSAAIAATKAIAGKARDSVAMILPVGVDAATAAQAFAQGAIIGTRSPGLKKGEPNRHPFGELTLIGEDDDPAALEAAATRGEIIGNAVNLARDLINTPPAEKSPTAIAERARAFATKAGLKVTVWGEEKLHQERFGGLLAVGAGSDEPPAFVIAEYRGAGEEAPTYALVGKGVCFDSGGLSLKPSASMEDMKADMSGAAAVLSALQAIARLKVPVNLIGYCPFAENMTGGEAMKLGDVLTIRNGKTVEVLNTDAEGRLILADALSYAAESQPAAIVDLATLTGACVVALGTKTAGLFANNDEVAGRVQAAADRAGERIWRLPLDETAKDALKSQVADLKNVGGKWGGAITAAKFLEQFVDGIPWAHLDIAGPAWSDSETSTQDAGGTGYFVRSLIALAEGWARPKG